MVLSPRLPSPLPVPPERAIMTMFATCRTSLEHATGSLLAPSPVAMATMAPLRQSITRNVSVTVAVRVCAL